MDWAHRAAECSHAVRLKVGSVIVQDDTVVSYGFNGMPAGWDNICEHRVTADSAGGWLSAEEIELAYPHSQLDPVTGQQVRYGFKTNPQVLHSERNALDKLARKGNVGGAGATMFVTHSPCLECAKSIYGAGILAVYYGKLYRDPAGIDFLNQCGVHTEQLGSSV